MIVHHQDVPTLQTSQWRQARSSIDGSSQVCRKPENTALTRDRLHLNDSTHVRHQMPGDRQSQPCTPVLAGRGAIRLGKSIKDASLGFGTDANAGVMHFKLASVPKPRPASLMLLPRRM